MAITDHEFEVASLEEYLRKYVKQEGLQGIIPERLRPNLISFDFGVPWLVLLWGIPALLILTSEGYAGLLPAVLLAPGLGILTLFVAGILFAVRKRNREVQLGPAVLNIIAFALLPPLNAAAVALYLRSWHPLWQICASLLLGLLCLIFLQKQAYRVSVLWSTIRLAFRMARRSLTMVVVLIPILLVLVFFSVYSTEFWQAITAVPWSRIPFLLLVLAVPSVLLVMNSLRSEAEQVIGEFPDVDLIATLLPDLSYIRDAVTDGLLSIEEVKEAQKDLIWRHSGRLSEDVQAVLIRRVETLLNILFLITASALFFLLSIYLGVLFRILLSDQVILDWTGQTMTPALRVSLEPLSPVLIPVSQTNIAIAKVSIVLAAITAAFSMLYVITDEKVQERYREWLAEDIRIWMILAASYSAILSPGYQLWKYIVNESDIANLHVIVPEHTDLGGVEEVCTRIRSDHESQRLVIVRAFTAQKDDSRYGVGSPSRSWQYIDNKFNGHRSLEEIPGREATDVHDEHELGVRARSEGKDIPDAWFGNTSEAIRISKDIWTDLMLQRVLLHPYARQSNDSLFLHLRLAKRLKSSSDYRALVKAVANAAWAQFGGPNLLMIHVYYRGESDEIASLLWNRNFARVTYSDEHGKSRTDSVSKWHED